MGMHVDSHSKSAIAATSNVSKLPLSVKHQQQHHQQQQSSTSSVLLSQQQQQQHQQHHTAAGGSNSTQQQQQQQHLASLSPLTLMPAAVAVGGGNSRPASVISSSQHSMSLMQSGGSSSIKMGAKYADSLERQSMGSSATDLSQSSSPNCSSGTGLYEGLSSGAGNNGTEPRLLTITTKKNTNLGISLMGGNAVGIYVHDVQKSSLADAAGMRMGDQILEYNGADLRRVTAEQAANEISRPAETVTIVVQHNLKSKREYLAG